MRLSLIMVGLLLVSVGASAKDIISRSNNAFEWGVGVHDMKYTEHESSASVDPLDSETGKQAAMKMTIKAQDIFLGVKNTYFEANWVAGYGKTTYNGYLQDSNGNIVSPYTNKSNYIANDVGMKLGKGYRPIHEIELIPYGAYNYHRWTREMTGDYGYTEKYSHHELGLGLIGQWAVTEKWLLRGDVGVGTTVFPKMSMGDTDYTLGRAGVYTGSVALAYAFRPQRAVQVQLRRYRFS